MKYIIMAPIIKIMVKFPYFGGELEPECATVRPASTDLDGRCLWLDPDNVEAVRNVTHSI